MLDKECDPLETVPVSYSTVIQETLPVSLTSTPYHRVLSA